MDDLALARDERDRARHGVVGNGRIHRPADSVEAPRDEAELARIADG
jgi:hypothetical protein